MEVHGKQKHSFLDPTYQDGQLILATNYLHIATASDVVRVDGIPKY